MKKKTIFSFLVCMILGMAIYSPNIYANRFENLEVGNLTVESSLDVNGVINGVLSTTGDTYYVDSGSGHDTPSVGKDRDHPFDSIDYAIGRCTANQGDVIVVMPGHTETITADSGIDVDVAGITIIGEGKGEDRPIITFTTIASADFKMAAANTAIFNMVFKCNIHAQDMMIETSADDVEIGFCEFREGTTTGNNHITIGVADGDSDRAYIHDNIFYEPTALNGDSAISFAKDMAGVRIERNKIYGDWDLAGIDIPAGGNAQVDAVIKDNDITNLLTGQHCIQINGTGSTGQLINNTCVADTQSASIDAGGLESFGNYFSDGTDQVEATLAIPEQDGTYNVIGYDDNNNSYASTNVAANRDGSILERTEFGFSQNGTDLGLTLSMTSSSIPSNAQSYSITNASSGGRLLIKDIIIQTDATGWTGPTNYEITTDNAKGLTGADAPQILEAAGSFGANATFIASTEGDTKKLPFVLESGKKLFLHGDDAPSTGAGTADVTVIYERIDDGAEITVGSY